MASAPRFSGGRYKIFEARKAVVEKMITCVRRPSEIDSDQPGLCFREWNAHARSRPAIHDSDQKFTLLDPRLILERFIFREAHGYERDRYAGLLEFSHGCLGFFMRLVGGND
jgi:hypothetical protein